MIPTEESECVAEFNWIRTTWKDEQQEHKSSCLKKNNTIQKENAPQ